MTSFETDLLAELIEQRHGCLIDVQRIGVEQEMLVNRGDTQRLLERLATKQKLLDQLQQIERQLDPFRQQEPTARTWRSEELRQHCAQLISESEEMLAGIVALEKKTESELCRRRDEAAERLAGFHTASQTRGAYAEQSRVGRKVTASDVANLDMSSEG